MWPGAYKFLEAVWDYIWPMVKNIVALGALQATTGLFPPATFLVAIRQALSHKCALIPLNEEAFAWGVRSIEEGPAAGPPPA